MSNFNVNISVDDVLEQKRQENAPKGKSVFNVKNYLQARLGKDETAKTLTIRLLPFTAEGGSPFEKVHFHQVKVNEKVAPNGWKKFPCPIKNHEGDKCPFCETAAQARELRKNATTDVEKKKYEDIEKANYAREMWIVRCIERGHEEDGVKFWLFSNSKKKDGIYDKIMAIFQNRYLKAKEQGKYNNIFDLNEGKDLIINLSKDSNGNTAVNITDDDEKTPLSTNFELAKSWIEDPKKWNEVYTYKPYDYMSIIVQGGKPVFSKEHNKYVDKDELDKEANAEIEANLTKPKVDLSVTPIQVYSSVNGNETPTFTETTKAEESKDDSLNSIFTKASDYGQENDEEDDLPF